MWQTELMLFGRLNIITNYGITKKLFKFVDTLYKDGQRKRSLDLDTLPTNTLTMIEVVLRPINMVNM